MVTTSNNNDDMPQYLPNALLSMVIGNTPSNGQDPERQLEFRHGDPGSANASYNMYTNVNGALSELKIVGSSTAGGTHFIVDMPNTSLITGGDRATLGQGEEAYVESITLTKIDGQTNTKVHGQVLAEVYSPEVVDVWAEEWVYIGKQIQNAFDPKTLNLRLLGESIVVGNTSGASTKSSYVLRADTVQEVVDDTSEEFVGGNKYIEAESNRIVATNGSNRIMNTDLDNKIETAGSGSNILQIVATLNSPGINLLDAGGNSENILRNNSVDNFKTENGLNTSDETIFFSDTNGDHQGQYDTVNISSMTDGDGIRFKEGGALTGDPNNAQGAGVTKAPNNNSLLRERTFADYFYESQILGAWTLAVQEVTQRGNAHDAPVYDPLDGNSINEGSTSGGGNSLSYVKTGHVINVWGKFDADTGDNWGTSGLDGNLIGDAVYIAWDFHDFPYKHSFSTPCIVDVLITTNRDSELDNMGSGNHVNKTSLDLKGLIYPNDRKIWLYKYIERKDTNTAPVKLDLVHLAPSDLADDPADGPQGIEVSFNFTMATNLKSYDQFSWSNTTKSQASTPAGGLGGNAGSSTNTKNPPSGGGSVGTLDTGESGGVGETSNSKDFDPNQLDNSETVDPPTGGF